MKNKSTIALMVFTAIVFIAQLSTTYEHAHHPAFSGADNHHSIGFGAVYAYPPGVGVHRQLKALAGEDHAAYHARVDGLGLREELAEEMHSLRPAAGAYEGAVAAVMKRMYDERLKLTGQNGLSDYDVGFTNFLWTFTRSTRARQDRAQAVV